MVSKGQIRRLVALAVLLVTVFAGLACQLVKLQVVEHEHLRALAIRNTARVHFREALRGRIMDARGNPLAMSQPAKVVCADPTLMGNWQAQIAHALAPLLEMPEGQLVEKLNPRIRQVDGKVITNSYVVLRRKVPMDTWKKVEETMTNLTFGIDERTLRKADKNFFGNLRRKSVFSEEDEIRVYPNGNLASHVIGYVGGDEGAGQAGVEHSLNSQLTGIRGWRRTETDVRRREMVAYRDQDAAPLDGVNVVLTLDSGLQNIVETELVDAMQKHNPISISCTMIRPRTGEILAMATFPNFDPNRPGKFPPDALRNRVIADLAEPGSTFKLVVVSAALNEAVVKLDDQFDCEHGHFFYAGRTLHDHESYGVLSVERIITKSSNIGAAKVGIKLGEDRLYDYIRNFGFGTRTSIPLPGEVNGILHPVKNWSKVSIAQIPMGHGIAVTSLQTIMAMSAIANGGKLMRPMLIKRLEDQEGQVLAQYQPQFVRQVISDWASKEMIKALKTVVTDDGTAAKARLDHYTVAGKTGTAQKIENGTYSKTKFFSSFIGFFPADNPELCISIVMDEPKNGHFGGQTAAPFFKNIAERSASYLNLKPDIQPEPLMKTAGVSNTPAEKRTAFLK